MSRILRMLAGLVVVGAFACSGDRLEPSSRVKRCRQFCEVSKTCPDTDATTREIDCVLLCDDIDSLNRTTECYDDFDRLYDCVDKFGICGTSQVECDSFSAAYEDCVAEHCSRESERDDCGL